MSKSIPDKWLDYKPCGKVIDGTKILPFKVPLKETVAKNLQPEQQFTTAILLKNYPNIKYIVDLTNTVKYYDSAEFTKAGVKYQKVMIPGIQVPAMEFVKRFFKALDNFIKECGQDEIIGVHCTHGINRTGYLICRYLVQQLGWKHADAIKAFEEARGHGIERKNYVSDLKKVPMGKHIDTSKVKFAGSNKSLKVRVKRLSRPRYGPGPPGPMPPPPLPRRGFVNGGAPPFVPPPPPLVYGPPPRPGFGPRPPVPPPMGPPAPVRGPVPLFGPGPGPRPRFGAMPKPPPLMRPLPHPAPLPGPQNVRPPPGPMRMGPPGPPRLPHGPPAPVRQPVPSAGLKPHSIPPLIPPSSSQVSQPMQSQVLRSMTKRCIVSEQDFTVDTFEENLTTNTNTAVARKPAKQNRKRPYPRRR